MRPMLSVRMALEVRSCCFDAAVQNVVDLSSLLGVTRKLIGATFEGETKEADGSVYADVVIEGLSTEVRPEYYLPR